MYLHGTIVNEFWVVLLDSKKLTRGTANTLLNFSADTGRMGLNKPKADPQRKKTVRADGALLMDKAQTFTCF